MSNVEVDRLSEAIKQALVEYSSEVEERTREAIDKVGKKTLDNLRSNPIIPRSRYPKSGKHYSNSFTLRKNSGKGKYSVAIYNKKYRLTHLLEKGRKAGRYKSNPSKRYPPMRAFPHWAEAEKIAQSLFDELKKELQRK